MPPDTTNLMALSAADRARRYAAALIGTRRAPAGYELIRRAAAEARAYHELAPYPWYHFREWKIEDRGPYPRCMPFPRTIVKRGSRWLFGKPVQIRVGKQVEGRAQNEPLEKLLREAWQSNRMPTQMVAAAERAGVEGGIALKFAYDETAQPALSFQVLSVVNDVRLYYDPHDRDRLIMARVQYPFHDASTGDWYVYREEWTDQLEVHYQPTRVSWIQPMDYGIRWPAIFVVTDGQADPDEYGKWQEALRRPNPFGRIPITPIRNLESGSCHGVGDLWSLFRVIDRVNLNFHHQDLGNQRDSEPNLVTLDVDVEQTDIDKARAPGVPLALKSDETATGEAARGQVFLLEPKGALRPHMLDHAREIMRQIFLSAGSVDVDPEGVTNKGAMTQAVLTQMHAPLIELTEEKRKTFGEDGVAKFLENCVLGLQAAGIGLPGLESVAEEDHDSYDVQLGWPEYFALTEEEKSAVVTRLTLEIGSGLNTHERAVETVASIEGIEDVPAFKEELAPVMAAAAKGQVQAVGPQPEPQPEPAEK